MYAVEFETVARNHIIHLPDEVPQDCPVRVLVLYPDLASRSGASGVKRKPHPALASSVTMSADLLNTAMPLEDWDMLK
ncbi:hypothetical protein THIAE_04430 [Thiomicrospira aerophila AL3]|uniref:Uncharacterized protein n=1 Tax=Thiomicrospira aerophila AL3 TaxID=717772 RepID=W0DZG6_9GAMM|nr:hypothetical protein [Thiomicrospira aerophila]AHF02236.1 hypothetical protein THIAE_04430 [Thiomicrospira aerophila AL3]